LVNRSPPGISASIPTSQNGAVVKNSAARLDGIHVSAKVKAPFATPSSMNPNRHVRSISRPSGIAQPFHRAQASKIEPEIRNRSATSSSGGKLSKAIRMPR